MKLINTILEVQPRLGGAGGGKSNDEIVYELSDNIYEKLMDEIDPDTIKPELKEVSSRLERSDNCFYLLKNDVRECDLSGVDPQAGMRDRDAWRAVAPFTNMV